MQMRGLPRLQDVEKKRMEQAERLRYGRFFYRFPNGESGADVYDRITILETHLIRDIDAGRFPCATPLCSRSWPSLHCFLIVYVDVTQ